MLGVEKIREICSLSLSFYSLFLLFFSTLNIFLSYFAKISDFLNQDLCRGLEFEKFRLRSKQTFQCQTQLSSINTINLTKN